MPREYIRGDGPTEDLETLVDLSWSREAEYVQLGTVGRHTESHETKQAEGFYVQLNRFGCNDLIRKLRRARDQAFGRDE